MGSLRRSPNPIDQRACLPLGTQPPPARRVSVPAPLDPMTDALSLASGHLTTNHVPDMGRTSGFALADKQKAFLPSCNPGQPYAVWMSPSCLPMKQRARANRLRVAEPQASKLGIVPSSLSQTRSCAQGNSPRPRAYAKSARFMRQMALRLHSFINLCIIRRENRFVGASWNISRWFRAFAVLA